MKPRMFAPLALASTLLLAACPQAQAPAPEADAEEAEAPSPSFTDGSLTVSLNGGEAVVLPASECVIVNNGANGVVRGSEGAYELSWSDTGFRFVWDTGAGVFIGDVTGAIDGNTATFSGESNGMSVQGTATCD